MKAQKSVIQNAPMYDIMFPTRKNYVKPLIVIAAILLVLIALFTVSKVHALGYIGYNGQIYNLYTGVTFGDCMADNATGDIYLVSGCQPSDGHTAESTVKHSHVHTVTPPTVTAPIVEVTDNTPPMVENTPAPTESSPVIHPNSGRGNGSELDSNGNDVDPGNSGKNNGGD